jgi:release factor glutamine methyltransferase
MATLRQLLAEAASTLEQAGVAAPRLTAEVLLAHSLSRERSYLYAHPEAEPEAAALERFTAWIARRAAGVPLQYLTGEQEFFGRLFQVTPAVLIPRPETEMVVEAALERLPRNAPFRLADVGTGSGCLAITLALERPHAAVTATDTFAAALEIARANATRLGACVDFLACDLLETVPGPFDLIVSNPPYIAAAEWDSLQREVREHEPRAALIAGEAGTEVYARLIPQAAARLRPGGWLVLELGYESAGAVRALLDDTRWNAIETRRDLQGWERVLLARRR